MAFVGSPGWQVVTCLLAVFAGMLLPSLAKAKGKAQRIKSVNNLKNIGLAARIFSSDNTNRMPASLDEIATELGSPALRVDPITGQEYTWVGAGKDEANPNAILAYSPARENGREVLMADGSVQQVTERRFAEMLEEEARTGAGTGLAPALMARYGLVVPGSAASAAPAVPAKPTDPRGPGGMGGGGTAPGPEGPAAPPLALPLVAGLRSLQIDIPKSGRSLQFTRVLNLTNAAGLNPGGGSADIRFTTMSATAHAVFGTLLQVAAFFVGLALAWIQWRRDKPSSLWLAIGTALALLGFAELLVTWRALHLALIVGTPAIVGLLGLYLLARYAAWFRSGRPPADASPPPPSHGAGTSATATAVLLFAILGHVAAPRAEAQAATNLVSLVGATYEGTARDHAAEFEASLELRSFATNQTLSLFGPEVAVRGFAATHGEAQLWRDGERVGVLLPNRGAVTVKIRFLARVGGDIARRRLEFDLPPALASRVGLSIDEPDADLEWPAAVSVRRRAEGNATRVDAVLGPVPRLALSWTPRTRRATEVAVNAFGRQSTLVTLSGGVAGIHAVHDLQAAQGELRQLRLRVPAGQRLLRVTGDAVRAWDFATADRREATVDLAAPSTMVRVVVDTESMLESLPSTIGIALPRFADLKRESGTVAVRASEELGLSVERATGLDRIEPAEFAKGAGSDPGALFSAWRFLQADPGLALRVEVLQPRLEASTSHRFTVGADQSALAVAVTLDVKRAGIFGLAIPVPEGWTVDAIRGPALKTWSERLDAGKATAEIQFRERLLGTVEFEVDLSQVRSNLPPHLDLAGLSVPGFAREDGRVSVTTEPGIGVKTTAIRGLTEIPAGTLGRTAAPGTTLLAFKFVRAGSSGAATPWSVGLDTEQLAPVVRAETAQFATISEGLLTGRTVIRYTVENAPVQEFRIRVPAAWRNVEIHGPGIRRRDQSTNDWRVELQGKVRGEVSLMVTWDAPRAAGTNGVVLGGLATVGTERETGTVALLAAGQLQLSPVPAGDELQRIDTRELPAWARGPGSVVAAYRYARPGWTLPVEVRRFAEATVLAALIEQVQLRTVVADHGDSMTQMQLKVRNNGRQNLAVRLPAGATLWSAFVGGEPVRPAREGTAVLVPLEGAGADVAVGVELTYVLAGQFPRGGGRVRFESPSFDAPLKDARWELFLPPDHEYDGFGGTMNHDAAEWAPVVQDFTVAEYVRQESARATTEQSEAKGALSMARKEIAAGNYGFVERLTRNNRFRSVRDAETSRELRQLETDFNRVQGSNLINGQNSFANQNPLGLGDLGVQQAAPAGNNGGIDYDARVAEQQVEQLRKAQAVAVSRVQPLRVTLPTRGIRHAFVQVLQTGVDKTLTVSFRATATRGMGWGKLLAAWIAGFATLWIACAVVSGLRRRRD